MRACVGVLVVFMLVSMGCGRRARPATRGAATSSLTGPSSGGARAPAPGEPGGALMGTGVAGDPFLLCHMNGGADRTDYAFVGGWHCADGSVPLGGSPEAGAAARVGNVGSGPDGHIVDLYRVPCSTGPVDLYVDGYHCGAAVETEIDMNDLSRAQLTRLAATIRALHQNPSELSARRELLLWTLATPQVHLVICDGPATLLARDERHPYLPELMLGLAASIIEDGRVRVDPVRAYAQALRGVALYYEALLSIDPSAADPTMDRLRGLAGSGVLEAEVASRVSGCDLSGMGVDPSVR